MIRTRAGYLESMRDGRQVVWAGRMVADLTTHPETRAYAEAIASTIDGLKPRGKLLIVAAPLEPMKIAALPLLSGKTIAGWPSGSAIDSEETVAFSVLTGVRPRVEVFKLEQAEQALAKMLESRVRFRSVLTP